MYDVPIVSVMSFRYSQCLCERCLHCFCNVDEWCLNCLWCHWEMHLMFCNVCIVRCPQCFVVSLRCSQCLFDVIERCLHSLWCLHICYYKAFNSDVILRRYSHNVCVKCLCDVTGRWYDILRRCSECPSCYYGLRWSRSLFDVIVSK